MAVLAERTLRKPGCVMCGGALAKSTMGTICNVCKDKLRADA